MKGKAGGFAVVAGCEPAPRGCCWWCRTGTARSGGSPRAFGGARPVFGRAPVLEGATTAFGSRLDAFFDGYPGSSRAATSVNRALSGQALESWKRTRRVLRTMAERGYSRLTAIGGELSRRSAWRRKKRLPVARGYSGL